MPDFVEVPLEDGSSTVLFEAAESDLVAQHGVRPEVQLMLDGATGRLEAISDAAQQIYDALVERMRPDSVEMEISVGLSAEVGWFVAKSSASGSIKLKLAWEPPPA